MNAERLAPPVAFRTPPRILIPKLVRSRDAWKDKAAYDQSAANLAAMFAKNFEKFDVPDNIRAAGPGMKKA